MSTRYISLEECPNGEGVYRNSKGLIITGQLSWCGNLFGGIIFGCKVGSGTVLYRMFPEDDVWVGQGPDPDNARKWKTITKNERFIDTASTISKQHDKHGETK